MKKKLHYAQCLCTVLPLLVLAPDLVRANGNPVPAKAASTLAAPPAAAGLTGNKTNWPGTENFSKLADITVQGKVTDEKNEPLPGVTVQLKGTTTGASTNVDGTYSLTLENGNGTLVFSYVGYTAQEVAINNRTTINVSLKTDAKALEEVVVVGYGTQKKADVIVAVASVAGAAIAERGTVNPLQAVQGQVAGVDISAGSGR